MERLKSEIKAVVERNDYILYDVIWKQEGKMRILEVSVMDQQGHMDIDTCAKISQAISERLYEIDLINNEYYLEVCSPGAERELRDEQELKEAIDAYIYVKLKDPKAGLDEVYGYLKEVSNDTIIVQYQVKNIKKKITIELSNVKLVRLSVKI